MANVLRIDLGREYDVKLYGEGSPLATNLADRMNKALSESNEGFILYLDLGKVAVVDLGFLLDLYAKLYRQPGRAIVFENTLGHASVMALPYQLVDRQTVVLAYNNENLHIHGRPFEQHPSLFSLLSVYRACLDSPDGLTSTQLLEVSTSNRKYSSQANASNQLRKLWELGLVARSVNPIGQYMFFYRPIFPKLEFTTDYGMPTWT